MATPAEEAKQRLDKFLADKAARAAVPPVAATPSVPTPAPAPAAQSAAAEAKARLDAFLAKKAAAAGTAPPPAPVVAAKPKPVVVTPPAPAVPRRQEVGAIKADIKGFGEGMREMEAEDKLRTAIAFEVERELPPGAPASWAREETERRLQERKKQLNPPLYMAPHTPTSYGKAVPLARPLEVPVEPERAPGFFEAMMPQTRVGEVEASKINAAVTAGNFDDNAFYQSIMTLPADQRQAQMDMYAAYKAAFKKMRELNPENSQVTTEELRADLNRQIQDLDEGKVKTFFHDPAATLGYSGTDPLGRALSPQVKSVSVPLYSPGQMEYLRALKEIEDTRGGALAAAEVERNLRTKGVEITRMVQRPTGDTTTGGKPVMETVQEGTGTFRPATEADITKAVAESKARTAAEHPTPLYLAKNRDTILANLESSYKGGWAFEKEYPTGATVEGPVSWFTRAAMAPLNAGIGKASELFTPPEIDEKERRSRPALYRDATPAVYNVAEGRGLMGEIGDLYDFYPNADLKPYANYGKFAGFAGDLIGFDVGLIGGAVTGANRAVTVGRAASAAEGFSSKVASTAFREGAAAATKEFLSSIGLNKGAKLWPGAENIILGDPRLMYGAQVGDSYRAADEYLWKFGASKAAGATDAAAHTDAIVYAEHFSPKAKFVQDAKAAGPAIAEDARSGAIFSNADEWQKYRRVSAAVDRLAYSPGALLSTQETAGHMQVIRPYLAAAVETVPEVKAAVKGLAAGSGYSGSVRLVDVYDAVSKLPAQAQNEFYKAVKEASAAESGFTTIDRVTKGTDPARFTVRLTPNTFVAASDVDKLLTKVQGKPEYTLLERIRKGGLDPKTDSYIVSGADWPEFKALVLKESTTGTLPRRTALRMVGTGVSEPVHVSDMRALHYALLDTAAAEEKLGFRTSALASRGTKLVPGRGAVPIPSTRALDYGENVGTMNSVLRKAWTGVEEAYRARKQPKSLKALVNPDQALIIEDARRATGAIPARLKDAMETAPGANNTEKLINLSLRTPAGTPMYAMRNVEFWNDVAKSAVFGSEPRDIFTFLGGEFEYRDPFEIMTPEGQRQLYALSVQFKDAAARAGTDAKQVSTMVAPFIDAARDIVTSNLKKELQGSGLTLFSLKQRPEEVLLGAWARKEATAIQEEALAKVLDFEPDTVGDFNAIFRDQLKGVRNAQGESMAGIPLSVAVAHVLTPGSTPLRNIEDVIALPGVQKWMKDLDAITGTGGGQPSEQLLRMFGDQLFADIYPTAGAVAARYHLVPPETVIDDMERMLSGKATLDEMGGPLGALLGDTLRKELGGELKFAEFKNELGALAEEQAKGGRSFFTARRRLTDLNQALVSSFYNGILYINPRFHGINVVTAPFIGHMTTGRVPGMKSLTSGAASEVGKELDYLTRAKDKFNIPYTDKEIYDAAIKGGAFKSMQAINVDKRFLDEARTMGLGVGMFGSSKAGQTANEAARLAGNLVSIPANIAADADIAWRMAYVKDALASGKTMDEALEIGRRSLFDYGSATDVERKYVARKILFYNFWRNSMLQTGRAALVNPGRLVRQIRLTEDVSKIQVGDSSWNDLRFYTPYDAGVSRMVMKLAPQANKEGQILLTPNMPYYDAVYMLSGLFSAPVDFLSGGTNPATDLPEYGAGYIFSKATPSLQFAMSQVVNADMLYDMKMTPGVAPVAHIALADNFGLLPYLTKLFNMKVRPEEPGEEGYGGMVYTMSDEDFEAYRTWLKGVKLAGYQRGLDDFGKVAASLDLFGDGGVASGIMSRTSVGASEMSGVTSAMRAGLPVEAETKAAKIRADRLAKEARARAIRSGLVVEPEKEE